MTPNLARYVLGFAQLLEEKETVVFLCRARDSDEGPCPVMNLAAHAHVSGLGVLLVHRLSQLLAKIAQKADRAHKALVTLLALSRAGGPHAAAPALGSHQSPEYELGEAVNELFDATGLFQSKWNEYSDLGLGKVRELAFPKQLSAANAAVSALGTATQKALGALRQQADWGNVITELSAAVATVRSCQSTLQGTFQHLAACMQDAHLDELGSSSYEGVWNGPGQEPQLTGMIAERATKPGKPPGRRNRAGIRSSAARFEERLAHNIHALAEHSRIWDPTLFAGKLATSPSPPGAGK